VTQQVPTLPTLVWAHPSLRSPVSCTRNCPTVLLCFYILSFALCSGTNDASAITYNTEVSVQESREEIILDLKTMVGGEFVQGALVTHACMVLMSKVTGDKSDQALLPKSQGQGALQDVSVFILCLASEAHSLVTW
jgi:hypothetical protein